MVGEPNNSAEHTHCPLCEPGFQYFQGCKLYISCQPSPYSAVEMCQFGCIGTLIFVTHCTHTKSSKEFQVKNIKYLIFVSRFSCTTLLEGRDSLSARTANPPILLLQAHTLAFVARNLSQVSQFNILEVIGWHKKVMRHLWHP